MTLLRKLRISKGLTQLQLSEILEISPEYVSRLENGNRHPSWEIQLKLEQFFGIPARDLLELVDTKSTIKE